MTYAPNDVADLLEKVADYIETVEGNAYRRRHNEAQAKVAAVAAAISEATGEPVTEALREKLAQTDENILDLLLKQAQATGGSPDSLGGPAEIDNTKTASQEDPDERFVRYFS